MKFRVAQFSWIWYECLQSNLVHSKIFSGISPNTEKLSQKIHGLLRMRDCRFECVTGCGNYSRIHLSNNKFINGILRGTLDLAGLQCTNTSFIFQLDFKANNKGNLLPYNGPLNGSFEVSLNEGLFSTLRLVILDYNTATIQYFMLYSNWLCYKQPQLGCVNTSRMQRLSLLCLH